MENNESMLDVYLFEATSLLEQLDEILISCEKQNTFDTDSINEIFRIMHTIKGSSAMMQFNSLMVVAHKMEDLFAYVRENGLDSQYNEELFDLMFKSGDFLKAEIDAVQQNTPLSTNIGPYETNINNLLNKISSGADAETSAGAAEQDGAAQSSGEEAPSSSGSASVQAPEGYTSVVRVFFDEDAQMENLRAFMLVNTLLDVCPDIRYQPEELQDASKSLDEIAQNGFTIYFRSAGDWEKCSQMVENFVYVKKFDMLEAEKPAEAAPVSGQPAATQAVTQETPKAAAPDSQARSGAAAPGHPSTSLINVNLARLDSLMDLMGEIVVTESMVTSIPTAQGVDMDNFTKASRQLRKLTDELQEIVMSIRMVPVNGTFQKMNRIVRDMSKKLDKDVELVLEGEDTEVDKTIVDNLADPLMHLVRNAMDHGIEPTAERLAAGKPARGTITLSAQNTGGEILVTVEDDGQGFDSDAILRKAKQRGLLKKAESEYTQKEIFALLLMPGFSTNETVTEFSGRGVGMDVVKKNIEKVGGDVTLESERGKGTVVTFKIPLTLAIVNGMGISVGDSVFTIPINNIRQSFKLDADQIIHDTEQNEIVMIRSQYYPLVRLHDIYGIDGAVTDLTQGIVILVETDAKTYCVFADALLGEQQVVIKPVPKYLTKFDVKERGVAGCAILGDGNICLILDAVNLMNNQA